ncbi:GNAT family N-acetyltransferase [Litoricolaceae bacterium]|nr:GNAT family N-acetyltransferase [Litorivicinaceae bacterium]
MSMAELNRSQGFSVRLATNEEEIEKTQRLRYEVFAREMGAQVHTSKPGVETDDFDVHCEHLLVEELSTGRVVASTRLLRKEAAQTIGRFYSESEFSAGFISGLNGEVVELGRTCVHIDFRSGGGIMLLWSGIAQLMKRWDIDYLLGCASVPCRDDGQLVQTLMNGLRAKHMSPQSLRAKPRVPVNPWSGSEVDGAIMPPLLKAYLRLSAWVCGEPSLDEEFGVADLMVLLDMRELNHRYFKHFLGRESKAADQVGKPQEVAITA